MIKVFKHELKTNLKSVLIWSTALFLTAAAGFGEYVSMMKAGSLDELDALLGTMPRIVQVMFGMGSLPINTPMGWYACMFLWCAVVAYLYAALLGASIISKEESEKTSEFLYTRPIKRSQVMSGKILASILQVCVIVFFGWLSVIVVFAPHLEEASYVADIHLTMFGMLLTSIVFLFVGLCLSAIFSEKGKAATYSAAAVVATYFISVAIEANGDVDFLNFLSPFRYFETARMIEIGIEAPYVLLSAFLVFALGALTYVFYCKRDLRS